MYCRTQLNLNIHIWLLRPLANHLKLKFCLPRLLKSMVSSHSNRNSNNSNRNNGTANLKHRPKRCRQTALKSLPVLLLKRGVGPEQTHFIQILTLRCWGRVKRPRVGIHTVPCSDLVDYTYGGEEKPGAPRPGRNR
jgi:hypothetical protein